MVAIDRLLMAEIMRQNRAVLAKIPNWIQDTDYEASIFHYGLPRQIRPFINRSIGEEMTYSDLIAYMARALKAPVRYFELGVSVGKNFFQMLHQLKGADIVGFDIEDINPALERVLEKRSSVEWDTMAESLRKRSSRLTEYAFAANDNRVRYLAGDVFDEASWQRLAGEKFNLVFSDAYHSGDALIREWEKLKRFELLDAREFTMLWDDLDSPEMQSAFAQIIAEMQTLYGVAREDCGIGRARGWIGPYEPPHQVGLAVKRAS
jgi:hypothetical protein